jgi:SSS family solute:Na+ symporter
MYLGFGALLFFAIKQFGFPGELFTNLPVEHKSIFGGFSWQVVLSWWIISLQTFVDPSFHQRCAAAKSPAVARKGIIVSIVCWIVFDFLTLATGLYAKAYFAIDNPLMAFPELGSAILPAFWNGLFVVALLATVMSTLDSYAFLSAATIGNDILLPITSKKGRTNTGSQSFIKLGLILTGIFGVTLAIILPSAVQLIYKTSSIAVPGLLGPLLISYSKKWSLTPRHSIVVMLISASVATFWTIHEPILKILGMMPVSVLDNIEPMLPGIICSIVLSAIFIKASSDTPSFDLK